MSSPINPRLITRFLKVAEETQATDPDIHGSRYILLLKIFRWQLRRKELNKPADLENLRVLKTGVRNAELLIEHTNHEYPAEMEHWHFGCNPPNGQQNFANFVWTIILSLTTEIVHTERRYPHLKAEFDAERARYRTMKDEAFDAEKLD